MKAGTHFQNHNVEKLPTLVDLLTYQAHYKSEQTAYIFLQDGETESSRLTYQQLEQQAKAIAVAIQSIIQPGDRALMLYNPGEEFLVAYFACLYAGVIAVPAYPPRSNHNLKRLQAIISDSQANLILTTNPLLEKIQTKFNQEPQLQNIQWLATETIKTELASNWKKPELTKDTIAFLQYTSGSTGNPKGVMVSHHNLLHNERLIKMAMSHSQKTIFAGWLPLFHDMGLVGNMIQPLYLGIPSILMPPVAFLQKPIRWLQAITRYKATTSGGPNFAYDLCVRKIKPEQCSDIDLTSWAVAFNGAEPIRAETLEAFTQKFATYGFRREAFYPCYGMAETTLFVSGGLSSSPPVFHTVESKALAQHRIESLEDNTAESQTFVGCGQSFFDKIMIVDPQSKTPCQPDQVGEIWVAGSSVAQGYWNRPQLSQEMFQAYLADTNEGPFLRTGDLGFFHWGELYITGRIKDVIIIRGRNHYPQDIELTVEKSHPALRAGCGAAFSVKTDQGEQVIIAQEVERSHIRKLNIEEIVSTVRQAVFNHHELQVYGILLLKTASIPKTSSGKIQRHACKQGFLDDSLKTVGVWKAIETESQPQQSDEPCKNSQNLTSATAKEIQQWIINWLAQNLSLAPATMNPKKPLADYGLDSVNAVELAQALGEWLGEEIDPTLAWNFPSIEAVAHHLGSSGQLSPSHPETSLNHSQLMEGIHAIDNFHNDSNELIKEATSLGELSEEDMAQLLAQELAIIKQGK
ncbi:MAG: AMP-binding protein [Crocosphaera sp.]|nr:AMP-binding protein [Crocosphaera sp.]